MSKELIVVGSRGTPQWAVNRFRADALSQLLNDLMYVERRGLHISECNQVKLALGQIVNRATDYGDGSWFSTAIWQELQDFSDIYAKWNSHEGQDDATVQRRQNELRNLRKKRARIARKIRRNQHVFQNDLDLKLISDMYESMGNLAKTLPEIFKELTKAVARFSDRMP